MSHWRGTMVDRPKADFVVPSTDWTVSGLVTLCVILAVWVLMI
jgi:hypothetical protein